MEKDNTERMTEQPFVLQGEKIAPGERRIIPLLVGLATTHEVVEMRTVIVRGKHPGPTLLLLGCLHGDEVNGTEILRRVLKSKALQRLRGMLIAVPIVNVPAFQNRSRYLPDRRDLNRLFPGSPSGSLGARIAHVISSELLPRADAVIDLHTGAVNRPNYPQVRVTPDDPGSLALAEAFDAPVTLLAALRDSSLRSICMKQRTPIILFESGEALRLDSASIRIGVRGIFAAMRHLGLLPKPQKDGIKPRAHSLKCHKSIWARAPVGGLFTPLQPLGRAVRENDVLGFVSDPFGDKEQPVLAPKAGILIGRTDEGLADEGDALFHIAPIVDPAQGLARVQQSAQELTRIPADEDDHPVPYDPFVDVV